MQGYALALAVFAAATGATLWAYEKSPRVTAWLIGFAAAAVTIGLSVWLDALAGLTATGTGLTVLACVTVTAGIAFWCEGIRRHKHHVVRTPVIAAVFGTAVVVAAGRVAELGRSGVLSPAKSATAFGQAVSEIHDGSAAHGLPPGQRLIVLAVAAVIVAVIAAIAVNVHKARHKGASRAGFLPTSRTTATTTSSRSRGSASAPARQPAALARRAGK